MTEKNEIFSPNKKYKLKFFDSIEARMGLNMSKFSLTEMQTDREINFPPLFAVGYSGHAASYFFWRNN